MDTQFNTPDSSASSSAASLTQRRQSARAVKRKKFDDEVVESSLMKPTGIKRAEGENVCTSGEAVSVLAPDKKKQSKQPKSKSKKSKLRHSLKQVGLWKPQDDLALITAVQQTCDLSAVHKGIRFSCRFTETEIKERWYNLLYSPKISKASMEAIRALHPDIRNAVESRTLFSKQEEAVLGTVPSTKSAALELFEQLLRAHPTVFHVTRTARALLNHWQLLKQYHLLPDQAVQAMPKGDHILNFSDAEDMINDEELAGEKDTVLEAELVASDKRQKREIRQLEQELQHWHVLVENVMGISTPEFDGQTLAVLRGRLVRYLMRSKEISVGRCTKDSSVDVDLTLEGPAIKVSRRQALIRLRPSGDFYLANEGKRPVYVDGKPVLAGSKARLANNAVVEVSCLRFVFLINHDLVRQEISKMTS